MLKSTVIGPTILSINQVNTAIGLRRLKSDFFKHYLKDSNCLCAEDLTALLISFVNYYLKKNNSLSAMQLFEMTTALLPNNIKEAMSAPNLVSLEKARLFWQGHESLLSNISNLGLAYQIFNSGMRKDQALPAVQKANKKISREELIAFTQLYTPDWVVDFLVANTILLDFDLEGISWRYLQWLMPSERKAFVLTKEKLSNLCILDPACGAGQFLFSAFDLLIELYSKIGLDREEGINLTLTQNIVGCDIDEKGLWVAGLGLLGKYLTICPAPKTLSAKLENLVWVSVKDVAKNIDKDTFLGSIDKRLADGHILKQKHTVIVTNPPYIGRRSLSRDIKLSLKKQYPQSKSDLSAAFFEQCLAMLEPNGRLGVITQSSVLSIPSYISLRNNLLNNFQLSTIIYCGSGVFPLNKGEKIDSALLMVKKPAERFDPLQEKTRLIDLSGANEKDKELLDILSGIKGGDTASKVIKSINQTCLERGLFSGLFSAEFYEKLESLPKLSEIADIRQGLATTDNNRFVRLDFDVPKELIGNKWVPYAKGAAVERYANYNQFVVKWDDNGKEIKEAVDKAYPYLKGKTAWVVKNEEFYFRSGLCFSFINKTGLTVRKLPAGHIFDVSSSAIFTEPENENFLLAYLNSSVIGYLIKIINATINVQVGDLKKLPVLPFDAKAKKEMVCLGNDAFYAKEKLLTLENGRVLPFRNYKLNADTLSLTLANYRKAKSSILDKLGYIQEKIDRLVIKVMRENRLIGAAEEDRLLLELNPFNRKKTKGEIISEKELAYKLLREMVSLVVSKHGREEIVFLTDVNEKSLSKLFNLTTDGLEWLNNKLEIKLDKLFCRRDVVDISKLAKEKSRYFSLYFRKENSCIFFSASSLRQWQKSSNLKDKLPDNVLTVFMKVMKKLDGMSDWTSKDLLNSFKTL